MSTGTLYLVPTPLDHGCDSQAPLPEVLPLGTLRVTAGLTHWISENAKSTRAFLKRVDAELPLAQPVQAQQITELPRAVHKKGDHAGGFDARPLLAPALQGHDLGLVSEAGMPAVADPGSSVVRAAHELGIPVVPLVGPVSILLALAASGLNGQSFAFVGYLPQDAAARTARIRELEALALRTGQTQLFIETPYRNQALLQALAHTLAPTTWLAVGAGLTLPDARIVGMRVSDWRRRLADEPPQARALPAIHAIGP
ncbi:SAM-dependent methyltransferase [Ottowia sp.]|uniref:SAM-dependent methyltransferase n=1 Tax=Ottowia sp. TaxID=1898956 RepID=UPI0039E5215D